MPPASKDTTLNAAAHAKGKPFHLTDFFSTLLGADSQSRFIPAWAGNSCERSPFQCAVPVHPRVGGEQDRYSTEVVVSGVVSAHVV